MENSVRVYDGKEFLGTADVSEGGRFSFKVENLSAREHVFKAEASDGESKSEPWTISVQQPPLYEGFESGPSGDIPAGVSFDFPTMTVVSQATHPAPNGVAVEFFRAVPPMITGRSIVLWGLTPNNSVLLLLKRGARVVKFGIGSSTRTPAKVWCYNESDVLVCEGLTPAFGGADAVWAEFTPCAPYENELITKVVIEEQNAAYIDNFTLS